MKKVFFLFVLMLSFPLFTYSNGVAVVNAYTGVYFRLYSSVVTVTAESQISTTKTTLIFVNNTGANRIISFAFPLPDGASPTQLRWNVSGVWRTAVITPNPQDTNLPGGTMNQNLKAHLGLTPMFFPIPQSVKTDSLLVVELTYVRFLPYTLGSVVFTYPNDYHLIQTAALVRQQLDFSLKSPRTIDSIMMVSPHPVTTFFNNGDSAFIGSVINNAQANANYQIKYVLNSTQFGLYSYSTFMPANLVPDTISGFLTFIAEPDPGNTQQTIKKVFTLIVDRSGSMSGNKMTQAKQASVFITQNLNTGDKFNIVSFASDVGSFRNFHVPFNNQSRDSAINYINGLTASGLTNISGAFGTAIPQFNTANDSTANIIIFFTDGQPTTGITATQQLLTYIHNLIVSTGTHVFLYVFGIGSDLNLQLLTLMASQNSGMSEFLGDDEIYSRITNFYLKVRNPVLLSPTITFNPANVTRICPAPLPNLYKGEQLIVSGRYLQPGPVTVTLSGFAFNHPASYQYTFYKTDTMFTRYQFLTKIWAKQRIDNLLVTYYSLNPNSPEAIALRSHIVWLSMNYGVLCPLTSFGITGMTGKEKENELNFAGNYKLLGNYPNPFNPATKIKFAVNKSLQQIVYIRIYDILGKLVREISYHVNGKGVYEILWDSKFENGVTAPSGVYYYSVDFGDEVLNGRMILTK